MKDYMQNARPLRDLYGYSQTYVAYKLGISQSCYCKIECGKISPTISQIDKICSLYNIKMSDFLEKNRQELFAQIVATNEFVIRRSTY